MNRADRMLAVLIDGRPHTRHDIQFRKGYFLTNNAASELRKRGLIVNHWKEGRTDYYQLESPFSQPGGDDNRAAPTKAVVHREKFIDVTGPSSGSESGVEPSWVSATLSPLLTDTTAPLSPVQMSLGEAA